MPSMDTWMVSIGESVATALLAAEVSYPDTSVWTDARGGVCVCVLFTMV